MTKRFVTLSVVAAVVLFAQPVLAQRGGRPGGRGGHPGGGGGHAGYGRAVPRGGGSPGYVPRALPQARHPRAGTGYAAYGGRYPGYGHGGYPGYSRGRYPGYGHGGHYGHKGYYGHGYYGRGYYGRGYYGHKGYYPYYRPYYYGGYYPYYRPYYPYYGSSFGLYFGFGGPYAYGSIGVGWPYYGWYGAGWPGYYGYPSTTTHVYLPPSDRAREDDPADERRAGEAVPNTGRVRLEVRPDDASVYVDDQFWGPANESRSMTLRAGRHVIELVRPGYDVVRREIDVVAGEILDVLVDLQRP